MTKLMLVQRIRDLVKYELQSRSGWGKDETIAAVERAIQAALAEDKSDNVEEKVGTSAPYGS